MGTLYAKCQTLNHQMDGELKFDTLTKVMYATDASIYRKMPLAVAFPKTIYDIKALIGFCNAHKLSLIPRAAGTSLAGQCVGNGIVVDISKHFTNILSVDEKNRTVTVQPGVIRDELNTFLAPYGLFFGPNTSTSNRCMIGGMVGNNSSGTTSIKYGVTRDKVLELHTILSDGSEVVFKPLTKQEFLDKIKLNTLEGSIYKTLYNELKAEKTQQNIKNHFPKPEIHRRNTGYAIDELIKSDVFNGIETFNMCKLLAGSEGTLAFTTKITLKLDKLPPKESVMIAAHFHSIKDCLSAVKIAMEHDLYSCEMMDKTILDCTKHNRQQQENRSFIIKDPEAILMCELRAEQTEDLEIQKKALLQTLENSTLSYANVVLYGDAIEKANQLRKAGLGLLGNMIGDRKSAACIEDTAVALEDLTLYIDEFTALMKNYNQKAIYYAHAGAGELHLRPIFNLKKKEDVNQLRKLTFDVAQLVKKYNGSLSGEHGDGIVRSAYIPLMIGDENYALLKQIKTAFDPNTIFNPNKIVNPLPLDESLRYEPDRVEPEIPTLLDFSESQGILREAEKCNGSGDCRKLPTAGGTMCPSYHATRNEKDTTRARANALREFLTHSTKANRFTHKELKEVFELCLSCKACASECPSSVDVAALKAEFQYQYQKAKGSTFRDRFFAHFTRYNQWAAKFPVVTNAIVTNTLTSGILKRILGIHPKRSLPQISKVDLQKLLTSKQPPKNPVKTIYLFVDEFILYTAFEILLDAKTVLETLNYKVNYITGLESGRSYISKGFLEEAKTLANKNITHLHGLISKETPLVGIEPSAISTFTDEYIRLANDKNMAKDIARNTFLLEDFLAGEMTLGNIKTSQFTTDAKIIKFHGHCHQKALSSQHTSFTVLNFPKNFKATLMATGCCGMAGSFGLEKEHYKISMQIGEQALFPVVRNADDKISIAANGTSCRHQIKDGTGKMAQHPITILKEALR
ncbi:MAG TPA: FAD-linked oxidase C-terminal domain-containing protein [Flavobacteriaceae bacterium]|nr:FAD-linked oxidase C-terminal domain-containing protein [Flavobacteriaceae bacterium]